MILLGDTPWLDHLTKLTQAGYVRTTCNPKWSNSDIMASYHIHNLAFSTSLSHHTAWAMSLPSLRKAFFSKALFLFTNVAILKGHRPMSTAHSGSHFQFPGWLQQWWSWPSPSVTVFGGQDHLTCSIAPSTIHWPNVNYLIGDACPRKRGNWRRVKSWNVLNGCLNLLQKVTWGHFTLQPFTIYIYLKNWAARRFFLIAT